MTESPWTPATPHRPGDPLPEPDGLAIETFQEAP
jgi:hypothetical protein